VLLDAAPSPRYRALWAVQRWTAGRIAECLALRWGDLNGVVTFRRSNTKTKTTRQVPTAPQLVAELVAYRSAWEAEHGHVPGVNYVGGSRQLHRRVPAPHPPAMAGGWLTSGVGSVGG
jgi:integrase